MGGVRGRSYNELSVVQLTLLTEHPQNLNHCSAREKREREREGDREGKRERERERERKGEYGLLATLTCSSVHHLQPPNLVLSLPFLVALYNNTTQVS